MGSALQDELPVMVVSWKQSGRYGEEAHLLSIRHCSVLTDLRHTHLQHNVNSNIENAFYFWGLHPVAFVTKTLLWWPSIATKFFL
jgi:hypothetical protein